MKTINILPPRRQEELKYVALLYSVQKFFGISLASFVLVMAAQWGMKLYLQNQIAGASSQIEAVKQQVNKQENARIKQQITQINGVITDYKTLISAVPAWSKVIRAFVQLPPSTLSIRTLDATLSKKQMTITGSSPDRDSVIKLHDLIAADTDHFTNVDYPLENIAKPINVTFHYTFTIKDSLLAK